MEHKEFIKFLNEILTQYGFKKKGNKWFGESNDLLKVVDLQRSLYGNSYYLDYGFILKKIELGSLRMHISYGFGSNVLEKNNRIKELLNFENNINDEQRKLELSNYIEDILLAVTQNVETESDLLNEIMKMQNLNLVPLRIKKHFSLS
ncbi:DUF4304 domain-containing protein [Geobacter sp. FeAm09]|uniref:DUF4304 domain-containing protein n=1 Tax=Geobacter sp. FeAm09 TaxID=2597769 RepID=UPI0011EECD44|nr:DUF4304 domain-containing protein [Geobacter sp. FeAm09]QEM69265.1 DUF4304 domain-containing protein [Geobacter sp. FeAm09]